MVLQDRKEKKDKKESKIKSMVILGCSAWESFKLYLVNDDLRAYRLFFDAFTYFYCDGEKEEDLGTINGRSLGYKSLVKKYPNIAKKIEQELKNKGVNLEGMEFEYKKLLDCNLEL